MFLSALQYISGLSSKSHFLAYSSSTDENESGAPFVAVNVKDSVDFAYISRTASLNGKNRPTSICKIKGEKATIKSVNSYLSNVVRFWSADSIKKLDGAEFVYYIDLHSGSAATDLKEGK